MHQTPGFPCALVVEGTYCNNPDLCAAGTQGCVIARSVSDEAIQPSLFWIASLFARDDEVTPFTAPLPPTIIGA